MRYLFTVLISIFILSCSGKRKLPDGVLQPEKMQEVFWDFIKADVYTIGYTKHDSLRSEAVENLKLQNLVFKSHHTTREEFYKSYIYYSNHKELMTVMMDSITAKKQRELSKEKITRPINERE